MTAPTDSSETPLVSVVIVNYNGGELLDRCLGSVYAQPYRPIEVIVVDNGSTDGSAEQVTRSFPAARLIGNTENLGFAGGNLMGIAEARGMWIVLLNNDTEVESEWIPGLLELLRQPGVGVVTSRVVTDGVPDRFYEMNGSVNYLGYNIMRVFQDLSQVFFAGGASMMFRRDVVSAPFLPEYFLYHEDAYLSWRLRLEGYSVRMAQQSVVSHRGSATTRRQASAFVTFYQERNRLLNSLLLYEVQTLLRLLPYFFLDAIGKCVRSVVGSGKSLTGIIHSYTWCATHVKWIRRTRQEIQSKRRCPDKEIMCWMSSKVLDSDTRLARLANTCSRLYAHIVRLSSYD